MNRLPTVLETHIWELSGYYRDAFVPVLHQIRMRSVLKGIYCATHCHGCGGNFKAVFFGYFGFFCCRRCWRSSTDDGELDDFAHCKCDGLQRLATKTLSDYPHLYWPMGYSLRQTENQCIRTRPPIQILGYNVIVPR